jgi:hypothetical protein
LTLYLRATAKPNMTSSNPLVTTYVVLCRLCHATRYLSSQWLYLSICWFWLWVRNLLWRLLLSCPGTFWVITDIEEGCIRLKGKHNKACDQQILITILTAFKLVVVG